MSLLRFLLLATGLVGLLFSDAILSGRVLSQTNLLFRDAPWSAHAPADVGATNTLLGDVPTVFVPFLEDAARQMREGRLPIWSPRIFGGHPLLASFQSAVFSPFTWPALLLPVVDALLVAAVAKLLTGGVGMWLLLRRLGLAPAAVTFGAVAYLLNPFSVVWIEHPLSAVAAWLPWLLWSLDRLLASGTWRDTALAAGVAALAVLAGHPETTFKVALLAGAYAIAGAWYAGGVRRIATHAVPAALVALAIAAVQVWPFYEYLRESGVFAMRDALGQNRYAAPLETLVTAVVPNFFGNPARGLYLPMENAFGVPSNFCEQQIYAGIAVWLLAAVGTVCRWREWRVRLCASASVLAALVMYGVPGFVHAFVWLPGAHVVVLSRLGLITIAGAIVLAAYGLDAMLRRDSPPCAATTVWRSSAAAALAMAGALAAFLVWAYAFLRANGLLAATLGWSAFALALTLLVLSGIRLAGRHRLGPASAGRLAVAVIACDLLVFGRGFHPTMPRDAVLPVVPEIAHVRADPGLFRVAGLGDALAPNTAMAYGLQDVRGYDGMMPLAHARLLGTAHAVKQFARIEADDPLHLLDLLNVRYVFANPSATLPPHFTRVPVPGSALFRNERALPRAFLVDRVRVAPAPETLDLIRRQAIDLRREALLDAPPSPGAMPVAGGPPGTARVVRYEDTTVEVHTDAPAARLLVLSDLYHPGWRATVDGAAVPLLRANHALRAVAVPGGRHRVVFEYAPASVRAGAALSVLGLALLAAMAVRAPDRGGAAGRRRPLRARFPKPLRPSPPC